MLRAALAGLFLAATLSAANAAAQPDALAELRALAQKDAQAGDAGAKAYLELERTMKADAHSGELSGRWIGTKAREGVPSAQMLVGATLEAQQPPDYEKARMFYEKAAAQGFGPAMAALATMYQKGHGVGADSTKAFEWALKGANAGDGDAQYMVGSALYSGTGVAQDRVKGVEWFEKAATAGHRGAAFMLGGIYTSGAGVPADQQRARYWLSKFASDKTPRDVPAREKAARERALASDPEAASLFDAAERGETRAQARIAYRFYEGTKYPKDIDLAVYYFTKAAEAGDAGSWINLGSMHANGIGFPKDDAEALRCYRKAADRGFAEGQYRVASYLSAGRGGPRDLNEAARLYKLAADQHHPKAKERLDALAKTTAR